MMDHKIKCPKCKNQYDINTHLKYKVRLDSNFFRIFFSELFTPWKGGLGSVNKSNIVNCPFCGIEFKNNNYKYFGLIRRDLFNKALIVIILIFIFLPVFLLLWLFF